MALLWALPTLHTVLVVGSDWDLSRMVSRLQIVRDWHFEFCICDLDAKLRRGLG